MAIRIIRAQNKPVSGITDLKARQQERISELDLRRRRRAALLRRGLVGQQSLLTDSATGLSETLG